MKIYNKYLYLFLLIYILPFCFSYYNITIFHDDYDDGSNPSPGWSKYGNFFESGGTIYSTNSIGGTYINVSSLNLDWLSQSWEISFNYSQRAGTNEVIYMIFHRSPNDISETNGLVLSLGSSAGAGFLDCRGECSCTLSQQPFIYNADNNYHIGKLKFDNETKNLTLISDHSIGYAENTIVSCPLDKYLLDFTFIELAQSPHIDYLNILKEPYPSIPGVFISSLSGKINHTRDILFNISINESAINCSIELNGLNYSANKINDTFFQYNYILPVNQNITFKAYCTNYNFFKTGISDTNWVYYEDLISPVLNLLVPSNNSLLLDVVFDNIIKLNTSEELDYCIIDDSLSSIWKFDDLYPKIIISSDYVIEGLHLIKLSCYDFGDNNATKNFRFSVINTKGADLTIINNLSTGISIMLLFFLIIGLAIILNKEIIFYIGCFYGILSSVYLISSEFEPKIIGIVYFLLSGALIFLFYKSNKG